MPVLGSVLGEQLGGSSVPGDPTLSALVASKLLSGFRVVFFTGTDPNDASTYLRKPVEVGPDIRDLVIAEPFAESANVMVAAQARFLDGSKESSWRVLGGAVVVDPDTQAIPTADEQARNDAAQALELAGSKTKVFHENVAPTSGMSTGDIWFNADTTTVCPDPNCKGHGANVYGVPLVGSYPHRGIYWAHRYDGSAWKDAQRAALTITSEIAAGAVVTDKLSARAVTFDKATVGLLTDNLWPNGNSEESPPAGADTTTPEWAWRYTGSVYSGSWARTKSATATAQSLYITVPCSPGDSFYVAAMCAMAAGGANGAGVFVQFKDGDVTNGATGNVLATEIQSTTNQAWTKKEASGTAPAGTTKALLGITVGTGTTGYWDAIYARRKVSGSVLDVASVAADTMTLGGVQLDQHWVSGARMMNGRISASGTGTYSVSGFPVSATVTRVAGPALQLSVARTGELAGGWRAFPTTPASSPQLEAYATAASGSTTCDITLYVKNEAGTIVDPATTGLWIDVLLVNFR